MARLEDFILLLMMKQGYAAFIDFLLALLPANIVKKLKIARKLKAVLVTVLGMGVLYVWPQRSNIFC